MWLYQLGRGMEPMPMTAKSEAFFTSSWSKGTTTLCIISYSKIENTVGTMDSHCKLYFMLRENFTQNNSFVNFL